MEKNQYDFCGWATRNDLKCSDGRVIRRDAFKHCDGQSVPLVWNHQHDDILNDLEHKDCPETPKAKEEKAAMPENKEPKPTEKTVKEVFDTLTDEQKNVVYAIIGMGPLLTTDLPMC